MHRLSPRQKQITMLVIRGYRPKRIANILYIQRTTVYKHLATIRKNYGIHNTIELINILKDKNICGQNIKLTNRGKDVFALILQRKTISEISVQLHISYSGVLRHREKMLFQNDCHSMTELIARYYGLSSKTSE